MLLWTSSALVSTAAFAVADSHSPPPLSFLQSDWLPAWNPGTRASPTISNFVGSVGSSKKNVAGLNSIYLSSFSHGWTDIGSVTVDDMNINVTYHRNSPYEIERMATNQGVPPDFKTHGTPWGPAPITALPKGIDSVYTAVRMKGLGNTLLMKINISGTGTHNVSFDLRPQVRKVACIDGWGCVGNPAFCEEDSNLSTCTTAAMFKYHLCGDNNSALCATDSKSPAFTQVSVAAVGSNMTQTPLTYALSSNKNGTTNGATATAKDVTLPASFTVVLTVKDDENTAALFETFSRREEEEEEEEEEEAAEGEKESPSPKSEAAAAAVVGSSFEDEWVAAASFWENSWAEAFDPNGKGPANRDGGGGSNFPVLTTDDTNVAKTYYQACATFLALWRTGPAYIGGSTWQSSTATSETYVCGGPNNYYWDITQHIVAVTMLNPSTTRRTLLQILNDDITGHDWLCVLAGCGEPGTETYNKQCPNVIGNYAFDTSIIVYNVMRYVQYTGDYDFLFKQRLAHKRDMTVDEYMRGSVILQWKSSGQVSGSSSEWLADYGDNAARFLEAVPLYMGAVPAIQAYNVYNLYRYAALLKLIPTDQRTTDQTDDMTRFRDIADAIVGAVNKYMYVTDTANDDGLQGGNDIKSSSNTAPTDSKKKKNKKLSVNDAAAEPNPGSASSETGFWKSILTNGTRAGIRTVVDFHALGNFMSPNISAARRMEMVNFAATNLIDGNWMHALALDDPEISNRPDHGKWGAYAAWPPRAADSFAELQCNSNVVNGNTDEYSNSNCFEHSLGLIRRAAHVAAQGPFGQATAILPNSFDGMDKQGPAYKTLAGGTQFCANAGTSWVDTIVRTLFGYRPPSVHPPTSTTAEGGSPQTSPSASSLNDFLWAPSVPRGNFTGNLSMIRAPASSGYQYFTITATKDGMQIKGQ